MKMRLARGLTPSESKHCKIGVERPQEASTANSPKNHDQLDPSVPWCKCYSSIVKCLSSPIAQPKSSPSRRKRLSYPSSHLFFKVTQITPFPCPSDLVPLVDTPCLFANLADAYLEVVTKYLNSEYRGKLNRACK